MINTPREVNSKKAHSELQVYLEVEEQSQKKIIVIILHWCLSAVKVSLFVAFQTRALFVF